MNTDQRSQLRWIVLWTILIALAHFALGTRTHALHGLHIVLGVAFLVPILLAANAFAVRGGVLAALIITVLYLGHILWSWRDSPLGNADQYSMLVVYLVVGFTAGRLVSIANRRARQRDEATRNARWRETISGLMALVTAIGARDPETLRHGERVARLCGHLAARMGLDDDRVAELRLAGLVHDVGKIGLDDDILFAQASFTVQQRAQMNAHVAAAARMIRSILGTERIAATVEAHHECLDGSGYPHGLKGEQISLDARILRVADVFAALSETRRYKQPMPAEAVLDTMRSMRGSALDGAVFAVLEQAVRDGTLPALDNATEPAHGLNVDPGEGHSGERR